MKTITKDELTKKLGAIKKVRKNGTKTVVIECENGDMLQSYQTVVAATCCGKLYLFPKHACSNTTNRHLIEYCGLNKSARLEALENEVAISVTE